MAQLLALEWDSRQARVAVVRARGDDVVVEHAFAVELAPRDPGQTFADVNVGERVAAALAARGIGRIDTLVAVGRASIELQLMSLPPAPDEEMPELVRFQAMQQFTTLGDDWPLDFFPIDEGSGATRSVLAAAISPEMVEQINQTSEAAGLRPRRLVLRPCAAASLLRRHVSAGTSVRLLVDLLADEADLTVLVDGTVVFLRTARLPGNEDSAVQANAMLGEVRRTIAAAQNQLGGRRVDQIVFCGQTDDHTALKELLSKELSLPIEAFDPLARLRVSGEVSRNPPEQPGRYAPLLGMLVDEISETGHAIDFLHPRKKPRPRGRRRPLALAAATAAVLVLGVVFAVWWRLSSLSAEIDDLAAKSRALDNKVKTAQQSQDRVAEIDRWVAGDVTWLDELHDLSLQFPPAEDARIEIMRVSATNTGGGDLVIDGLARDSSVVRAMSSRLLDPRHRVDPGRVFQGGNDEKYPWAFDETMHVLYIEEQTPGGDSPKAAARKSSSKSAASTNRGGPAS